MSSLHPLVLLVCPTIASMGAILGRRLPSRKLLVTMLAQLLDGNFARCHLTIYFVAYCITVLHCVLFVQHLGIYAEV